MIPLDQLTFWHWFALGAVLMILEVFVPGVVFLWLGVAAAITGIVFWTLPDLTLEMQLIVFAVLSVISVIAGRVFAGSREKSGDKPNLDQPGAQHVGAIYMLEETTLNGHGKVRIGDSLWSVELRPVGMELPKGGLVRVEDVEGATLIVESASDTAGWKSEVETDPA